MKINGREVNPIELLRLSDRVERRHRLGEPPQLTVAFLKDLAEIVQFAVGLLTVSQAYQLWYLLNGIREKCGEILVDHAEIAHWYSVDPFQLKESQRLGMLANLPRVQAQARLNRGDFEPSDWKTVYNLVLLATGDVEQALRARGDAMECLIELRCGRG